MFDAASHIEVVKKLGVKFHKNDKQYQLVQIF